MAHVFIDDAKGKASDASFLVFFTFAFFVKQQLSFFLISVVKVLFAPAC